MSLLCDSVSRTLIRDVCPGLDCEKIAICILRKAASYCRAQVPAHLVAYSASVQVLILQGIGCWGSTIESHESNRIWELLFSPLQYMYPGGASIHSCPSCWRCKSQLMQPTWQRGGKRYGQLCDYVRCAGRIHRSSATFAKYRHPSEASFVLVGCISWRTLFSGV